MVGGGIQKVCINSNRNIICIKKHLVDKIVFNMFFLMGGVLDFFPFQIFKLQYRLYNHLKSHVVRHSI